MGFSIAMGSARSLYFCINQASTMCFFSLLLGPGTFGNFGGVVVCPFLMSCLI